MNDSPPVDPIKVKVWSNNSSYKASLDHLEYLMKEYNMTPKTRWHLTQIRETLKMQASQIRVLQKKIDRHKNCVPFKKEGPNITFDFESRIELDEWELKIT